MIIYVIGSLQNEEIPSIARLLRLRLKDAIVYDEWYAHGPDVDFFWQDYSTARGQSYAEALRGEAARAQFEQDETWLNICDMGLLVYPAGRSAHLELGYLIGRGTPGHVLMYQEPERWDLMLRFAAGIHSTLDDFVKAVQSNA